MENESWQITTHGKWAHTLDESPTLSDGRSHSDFSIRFPCEEHGRQGTRCENRAVVCKDLCDSVGPPDAESRRWEFGAEGTARYVAFGRSDDNQAHLVVAAASRVDTVFVTNENSPDRFLREFGCG